MNNTEKQNALNYYLQWQGLKIGTKKYEKQYKFLMLHPTETILRMATQRGYTPNNQ